MAKAVSKMTPAEILAKGQQLIQLARAKETALRNKKTLAVGRVFEREIENGWSTSWDELKTELEQITGTEIAFPGLINCADQL